MPVFHIVRSYHRKRFRGKCAKEAAQERVKAGIFYFDGYHTKDEDGRLTGYGIELLQRISKYSHLNFDYVGYDRSWNDMLTMLENGEIDLVTSARKFPEREDRFLWTAMRQRGRSGP